MSSPTTLQIVAAALFALAVAHTFATKFFERLAHTQPRHAGLWHLLGEVEVVFGFWAMLLMLVMFLLVGKNEAVQYLDSRNFTEPMFVFAIMVIAGTRAVLQFAGSLVRLVARFVPLQRGMAMYFLVLAMVPLLGSFITEPAAMTLAALMLRDTLFSQPTSTRLKYTTLGVLFVNISIGGTLTPFAAPPVLMVAGQVGLGHRLHDQPIRLEGVAGGRGQRRLRDAAVPQRVGTGATGLVPRMPRIPCPWVSSGCTCCFCWVSWCSPTTRVFLGLFLFFLGFATAYEHQDRLILREACWWPSSWPGWWCWAGSSSGGCSRC
jgi:hypothetical protein